jgi:hypothetical protein
MDTVWSLTVRNVTRLQPITSQDQHEEQDDGDER